MITFLLMRHGQSLSNAAATLTGQLDIPLSETGIKQGELANQYVFENFKVDAIYSSDLCRAVRTVEHLSNLTKLPIIKEKAFREMHCGDWQGLEVALLKEKYGQDYIRWTEHDKKIAPPNGESFLQLQQRAYQQLSKIASENDGKTIVVATHGGVIKTLMAKFLALPIEEWKEKLPYVSNASVTVVEYDGEQYKIIKTVDDYLGKMKTEMPKGI